DAVDRRRLGRDVGRVERRNHFVDAFIRVDHGVLDVVAPCDVGCRRAPDNVLETVRAPDDVLALTAGAPDDVLELVHRAPDDVLAVAAAAVRAPDDVFCGVAGR